MMNLHYTDSGPAEEVMEGLGFYPALGICPISP